MSWAWDSGSSPGASPSPIKVGDQAWTATTSVLANKAARSVPPRNFDVDVMVCSSFAGAKADTPAC